MHKRQHPFRQTDRGAFLFLLSPLSTIILFQLPKGLNFNSLMIFHGVKEKMSVAWVARHFDCIADFYLYSSVFPTLLSVAPIRW